MHEYTNRKGDRYYLLEGTTKSGKPKYYASRNCQGKLATEMPAEFEFHEDPARGLVTVRKILSTSILPLERAVLTRVGREAGVDFFLIDIDKDSLLVYTPTTNPSESRALIEKLSGFSRGTAFEREWIGKQNFSVMLRFRLIDQEARLFCAERWCFRSSSEGWIPLDGRGSIEMLASRYFQHVDKESFFDQM